MKKRNLWICGGVLALMPLCSCTALKSNQAGDVVPVAAMPYDSVSNIVRENLPALLGQRVVVLPKVENRKNAAETGVTLLKSRPGVDGYANSSVVNPEQSMKVWKSKAGTFDNQVFDILGVDSLERKSRGETVKSYYLIVKNEQYPQKHWLELGETYDIYTDGVLEEQGELVVTDLATEGYIRKLSQQMEGRKLVNRSENNISEFSYDYVVRNLADGKPLTTLPKNYVWEVTGVEVVNTPEYAGLSYLLTSKTIKDVCARAEEYNFIPYEEFISNTKSDQARLKSLIKRYGRTNGRIISEGKVAKGFTTKMCQEALGAPAEIQKSKVKKQTIEKWIYATGATLTFRAGRLISTEQ